jgi:hypothetical protein
LNKIIIIMHLVLLDSLQAEEEDAGEDYGGWKQSSV